VLGLLRGLTASLDVSQSYLDVMTPYARMSMKEYSVQLEKERSAQQELDAEHSLELVEDLNISLTQDVRGFDKLGGVADVIQGLIDSGDILGCQVSVLENDLTLVDISAGQQSPYDVLPVTSDTVFNCFSVTKGVAAGAVHLLAERGLIDLHAPVCKYWPEFGVNGKEMITVAQVLNHQAGLANVGMNEMSRDPYVVCDSGVMLNILANSTPEHVPGEETKYHYLTFGWLVDGIVRGVTGTSLRDFVNDNIGKELSIEKEFMIGVPTGSDEDRAEVCNS
jgi:aarF domain-containing kinase